MVWKNEKVVTQADVKVPLVLVRGEMNITQNSTPMTVPAASAIGVPNAIDYRKVAMYIGGDLYSGFTVVNSEFVLPVTGFYEISGYINLNHPLNNAQTAVCFIINGAVFSPRPLQSFVNDGGVFRITAGEGSGYFAAGTTIGVAVASTLATSGLIVSNSTVSAKLLTTLEPD